MPSPKPTRVQLIVGVREGRGRDTAFIGERPIGDPWPGGNRILVSCLLRGDDDKSLQEALWEGVEQQLGRKEAYFLREIAGRAIFEVGGSSGEEEVMNFGLWLDEHESEVFEGVCERDNRSLRLIDERDIEHALNLLNFGKEKGVSSDETRDDISLLPDDKEALLSFFDTEPIDP